MPVLLLEKLASPDMHGQEQAVFQPCHLVINATEGQVRLFNVCHVHAEPGTVASVCTDRGVPLPDKVPCSWTFRRRNIRKVSLHNDDPLSAYMYAATNDFQLFFACESHRGAFYKLTSALTLEGEAANPPSLSRDPSLGGSADRGGEEDGEREGGVGGEEELQYEYDLDEEGKRIRLGKGSFGVVYSAVDLSTKLLIAVKEVEIQRHDDLQPLMDEINMTRHWRHPHIVRYLGCQLAGSVFRVFMEQVPGGSLGELLRTMWGPLDEDEGLMRDYTRQVLRGLAYLHDMVVVHRDIKGDNILVNQFDGRLKLTDFGTSKRLAGLHPRTESVQGTMQFMAPEVINSKRGYGLPADIWSLGCTVIEMATGRPPFADYTPAAAMFKVGRDRSHPDYPESLTAGCRAFLERCFQPDAADRACAGQLLADPWLAGNSKATARRRSMLVKQQSAKEPSPPLMATRSRRRSSDPAVRSLPMPPTQLQAGAGNAEQMHPPPLQMPPPGPLLRSVSAYPASAERDTAAASPLSAEDIAGSGSADRTGADGGTLQRKTAEQVKAVAAMRWLFRDNQDAVLTNWRQLIVDSRDSYADTVTARLAPGAGFLPDEVVADVSREMAGMLGGAQANSDAILELPAGLAELLEDVEYEHLEELGRALPLYRAAAMEVLRARRRGMADISPHNVMIVDKRLHGGVKAVRLFVGRLVEEHKVRLAATASRRKSMPLVQRHTDSSGANRPSLLRFNSTDNPRAVHLGDGDGGGGVVPAGVLKPALKRSTLSLDRGSLDGGPKRVHISLDEAPTGCAGTLAEGDMLGGDYWEADERLAEVEEANRALMSQLLETSMALNQRLQASLAERRAQLSGLPMTPPSQRASPSRVGARGQPSSSSLPECQQQQEPLPADDHTVAAAAVDPTLLALLRAAGLVGPDLAAAAARCAAEQFTCDTLLHHAEKDDLAALVPLAGPRCRLWALVQQRRCSREGGTGAQ